jgi:dihydroorotate dehydrogenase (fumarate)
MGAGYKYVAKPIIFHMTPDHAHDFMIRFCRQASRISPLMGLLDFMLRDDDKSLSRDLMGVHFDNPIGLSAGLDKNGDLLRCLDCAGFGFGTFGTMTAYPNPGNPRPWYHRLEQYDSLLIHAGLPSDGVDAVLEKTDAAVIRHGLVRFGSIGFTNKPYTDVDEMIDDYEYSFTKVLASETPVIEVNISCPNLQAGEPFIDPVNVGRLFDRLDSVDGGVSRPVMVKMPSTLDDAELDGILDVLAGSRIVNGVSIANLLRTREGYDVPVDWEGKMSGVPCRASSERAIAFTRSHYGDRFVINGIGGTFTADDAKAKLDAGADLLALVTGFMFKGPQLAAELKAGIREYQPS